MRFIKGPVFCNILLADEINRAAPKTQAALLQAMQEYKVTASGQTYKLEPPFLVFATQNPIEQEGTYPLPEAQLDRFMFMVDVNYPSEDEERQIVANTTSTYSPELSRLLSPEEIISLQNLVLRVPVADNVIDYAVALTRATRPDKEAGLDFVSQWLQWGAGPRASQYLILGAKARAVLKGRFAATIEDIRALAVPVLQHRIVRNFHAEAEGISSGDIVRRILDTLPDPKAR